MSISRLIVVIAVPLFALIIMAIIIGIIFATKKHRTTTPQDINTPIDESKIDYSNGYTSKWLFSYNEKDAFRKIKEVTDKLGLFLFAKVRLYDLVEPKKGSDKFRTLQYKIQAKHVDFVVCDDKLVARHIIELDDASHDSSKRSERDEFVDQVLKNCGYNVIRLRAVNTEELEAFLKS